MAAITSTYNPYDSFLVDVNLQLADTQTVTTGGALTVASVARILDVGAGAFKGEVMADISTVDATTGDELSLFIVQGSNSSSFASGIVNLAIAAFGDSSKTAESADNLGDERIILPLSNVREGTTYRYIRAYVLGTGTTPSMIVNQAYLGPRQH